jgi:threonine/homoserine/homoserine lactone efflux protein
MIVILIKGIIIGWFASLPMGPIGVLCVQRTLSGGKFSGFISGMGAAAADALFALIAGFGVNYIIQMIENQELLFKMIGSSIIVLIGLKIYLTDTVKQFRLSRSNKEGKPLRHFFTVFFLTLTNPGMILLFIWFFATLNIVLNTSNYVMSSVIVLGVFIGGSLWWFTVATIVNRLRNNLRIRSIYWFNKISGGIILFLGIVSIIKVLVDHLL